MAYRPEIEVPATGVDEYPWLRTVREMSMTLYYALAVLLFPAGCGLLYLTNGGYLSLGEPYVVRASADLRPKDAPTAFVGVNVVPMDRERVLRDQTVIVRDGAIEVVGGRGEVDVPGDALTVDGEGRYLMPGLADMHAHIQDKDELLLFATNGVTTVRNMWGSTGKSRWLGAPDQLGLRERVERGNLLGPTIYTAGPIMEGEPATSPLMPVIETPGEGRESVAWQRERGYDFVKVYDNLSEDTYRAILDAAKEHDLPVVGHVPKRVGLDAALAGGQLTIEHLTGYVDPDAAAFNVPEDRLEEYAAMTREAGVYNCPTIGLYQKVVPTEEVQGLEEQTTGIRYVPPLTRASWRLFSSQMGKSLTHEGDDYPARIARIDKRMTKILHEAGAKILLGTDTDNPYLVPGFSLHEELGYLVDAGLSPYEAIQAGTKNAAEALGEQDEVGTVAEGKRADLILVEKNPLEDVENVEVRGGVMLRGRWLPEEQLRKMLTQLEASYAPTLVDRVWPLGLILLGLFLIFRRISGGKRGPSDALYFFTRRALKLLQE
jgi:imidazolonepropionase-like amidohydrolase